MKTSQESAEIRGTSLSQGAKALVVQVDGQPLMAVLPADRKMDAEKLAKLVGGKKTKLMGAHKAEELTGLEIGAIPPLGSLFGLKTWVDESLGQQAQIVFNAGETTRSVKIKWSDFGKIESLQLGEFSRG